MKKTFGVFLALFLVFGLTGWAAAQELTPKEQLGKFLYFDENLSEPSGQSCASCHLPDVGFDDPDVGKPVSEGVIPGLFGNRNSPISAYAMYAPPLFFEPVEGLWIGGQFWDGRATGEVRGDPLADQALGPFLNPVEMANISKWEVVRDAQNNLSYGPLFRSSCTGDAVLTEGNTLEVEAAYDCIADSIALFERTALFGQFNSKYDAYLATCLAASPVEPPTEEWMSDCAVGFGDAAAEAARAIFSKKEWRGMQLFMGENNNNGVLEEDEGAMCAACHVADWTAAEDYDLPVQVPAWAPPGMVPPVFTDFTYDNLGVPVNWDAVDLSGVPPKDLGLGPIVEDPAENGKFKVMTLRNIGLSKPYAHNGLFKNLKDITHFYNTRDVPGALKKGTDWPDPEYPDTVNEEELGNLGLSHKDEAALVKFMRTLSDGWWVQ